MDLSSKFEDIRNGFWFSNSAPPPYLPAAAALSKTGPGVALHGVRAVRGGGEAAGLQVALSTLPLHRRQGR